MPADFDSAVEVVRAAVAAETGMDSDHITPETWFRDAGVESVLSVSIVERLEATFGPLSKSLLYEFESVGELATHLLQRSSALVADDEPRGGSVPTGSLVAADTGPAAEGQDAQGVAGLQERAMADEEEVGVLPPIFQRSSELSRGEPDSQSPPVAAPSSGEGRASGLVARIPGPTGPHGDPLRESVVADGVRVHQGSEDQDGGVAIVGMAGQFPQAASVEQFWMNLVAGADNIEEIPERLWDWRAFWDERPGVPGKSYSRWGGFIPDHREFDPAFFHMSKLEAEGIDPQERVFLECAYHALEHAQYPARRRRGLRVGVYVAVMWGSYQHYGSMDARAGSSYATIANRASFALDLTGPSLPVDTMCSGALVALHLGVQSIRSGETDMALVGGVNLTTHPNKYFVLSKTGFAAKDGRCRPFAAGANGYVPSEGVGALVLKDLRAAKRDGDRVLAIVRHSAVNHGGRVANLTVPSVAAQTTLLDSSFEKTGVSPDSIGYVEAHAPGTELGDPIEVRALTQTLEGQGVERRDIPIGSVKSNVGHLESAAGVASIVKVIEQMRHHRLVPSIHADTINPNIDFEATPLRLQSELEPWAPRADDAGRDLPYRAMINCFGAGGTNAHILLDAGDAGSVLAHPDDQQEELVLVSAQSERALWALLESYRSLVEGFKRRHDSEHAQSVAQGVVDALSSLAGVAPRHIRGDDRLDDLLGKEGADALPEALASAIGARVDPTAPPLERVAQLIEEAQYRVVPGCLPSGEESERVWFQSLARATVLGREALRHRVAIRAGGVDDLVEAIDSLLSETGEDLPNVHVGVVSKGGSGALEAELSPEYISRLVERRRLDKLADLWTQGLDPDWAACVNPGGVPVDLPLYPFDPIVCWAPSEPGEYWPYERNEGRIPGPKEDEDPSLVTAADSPSWRGSSGAQADIIACAMEWAGAAGAKSALLTLDLQQDPRSLESSGEVLCVSAEGHTTAVAVSSGGETPVLNATRVPLSGPAVSRAQPPGSQVGNPELQGGYSRAFAFEEDETLVGLLSMSLALASEVANGEEPLILGPIIINGAPPRRGEVTVVPRDSGFDVWVRDAEGNVFALLRRVIALPRESSDNPLTEDSDDLHIFQSQWSALGSEPHVQGTERVPASVLVVAGTHELASSLAQTPRFQQSRVQQLVLIDSAKTRLVGDGCWEVALGDLEGLEACLTHVEDAQSILFVGGEGQARAADELAALHAVARDAIRRGLMSRQDTEFTVATWGTSAPDRGTMTPSGLGGYARTLARETAHPVAHIDLDSEEGLSREAARLLTTVAQWNDHKRPYALRGGVLWRETLEEQQVPAPLVPTFRSGGHYVLVGGSGSIGRQLSQELASAYGARLTWTSRNDLAPEAVSAMRAITQVGGAVQHMRADAADSDEMRSVLASAKEAYGPIDGILHLAMSMDVRRIPDLSPTEFRKLLDGKVRGSDVVLQLAGEECVDQVILFSSVDAHIGSVGWSAYTSACGYQLGAAARARADGVPALAVAWGFWETQDENLASSLSAKGIGQISPSLGLRLLERLASSSLSEPAVVVADRSALQRMGLVGAVSSDPARRTAAPEQAPSHQTEQRNRPSETVADTPAVETVGGPAPTLNRADAILTGLTELFAEILKFDDQDLDSDVDLLNYGVDSLLIVNVQAAMEERLGPVPTAVLLENSTLREVAAAISRDHSQAADSLYRLVSDRGQPRSQVSASADEDSSEAAPASEAGGDSHHLLRRVSASAAESFLRGYPRLYEDKMLEADLAPRTVDSGPGDLVHGRVQVSGAWVEYFSMGSGDPVVAFSPVALTAPVWANLVASPFTERYRLIIIHQPGYGLSEAITGATNRQVAAIANEVLAELRVPPPYHVLGSCLGSVPALYFAADFPESTASVALVGGFHDASDLQAADPSTMSSEEFQKLAETSLETLNRDFDAILKNCPDEDYQEWQQHVNDCRQLLLSSQKVNFLTALRYLNEMMGMSLMEIVEGIQVPLLCIYGDADQVIRTHHSIEMAESAPQGSAVCIEGSAHFPYLTHTDQFLSAYSQFLDATPGPAGLNSGRGVLK